MLSCKRGGVRHFGLFRLSNEVNLVIVPSLYPRLSFGYSRFLAFPPVRAVLYGELVSHIGNETGGSALVVMLQRIVFV